MVLAAGFGTRMQPLTLTRPKALVEVAGRALIDHALDRVAEASVPRAVVNLHYLGDQIRAHLAGRHRPAVLFSEEAPAILETGGGLQQAWPLLATSPVFALNSDAIWAGPNPLSCLLAGWDGRTPRLLLLPRGRARSHAGPGDFFIDADGRLTRRGEAAAAPFVYTGAQIIDREAFEGAPPGAFSLNPLWDRLIAQDRIRGCVYPGTWVDVGTPEGISTAEAALAEAAAQGG
ncbi:MAG: nucleotidyltransferase family protein [Pikeienuella sp.]